MATQESWASIFDRILVNLREIIRAEVRLARLELTERARATAKAGSLLAVAAVLGLLGAWFILVCFAALLNLVLPMWLSLLIIGVLLGAGGFICFSAGQTRFRKLTTPQTVGSVRETVQWAKNQGR